MGSQAKAKTQTYDTGGLYGSASTGKGGTTFNPSDFQTNLVNQTQNGINQYLGQMINPTYDSSVFQAQTAQRNRLANQSFENNLINPLASRGLTRGSSVNQMSNQFANKLADMETDALATEDKRVANILSGLMNTYQMPYNMMTGMTNQTNQAYQNAVQQAAQENASKQAMYGQLAKAGAAIGGAAFGPVGSVLATYAADKLVPEK